MFHDHFIQTSQDFSRNRPCSTFKGEKKTNKILTTPSPSTYTKNFILKEKLLVGGSFSSPPVEFTKGSFKVSWSIYFQILSSAMSVIKLVYISFELLLEISVDCSTSLATIIQLVITTHVSSSTSENR